MSVLDRARDTANRLVDAGRDKANDVREKRDRAQLLRELGEARYAQSKGVTTSEAEIERLIGEIDALGRDDEDTSAT
jgi:hypothetical protein